MNPLSSRSSRGSCRRINQESSGSTSCSTDWTYGSRSLEISTNRASRRNQACRSQQFPVSSREFQLKLCRHAKRSGHLKDVSGHSRSYGCWQSQAEQIAELKHRVSFQRGMT